MGMLRLRPPLPIFLVAPPYLGGNLEESAYLAVLKVLD